MNPAKKTLVTFLTLVVLFSSSASLFFARPARAEDVGPWYDQDFKEWFLKVYDKNATPVDEIFGERYVAAQVQWVLYSIGSQIINLMTLGNREVAVCVFNLSSGIADIPECTSAGNLLKSILDKFSIVDKPNNKLYASQSNNWRFFWEKLSSREELSGVGYIKKLAGRFSLISETKADTGGYGYRGLRVIQPLWEMVRNGAYGLFVLFIIILAFMIMFRVKISPQVVITIQSALPKIVISLILVTFSYAIAGFLVDLIYVVLGIIAFTFNPFSTLSVAGISTNRAVFEFLRGGLGALSIPIYFLIYFVLIFIVVWINLGFALVNFSAIPIILTLLFIIFVFILTIILSINVVKIYWMMFKAVAKIFILTIFAPLQIAFGVIIPSQGFGAWVRNFLANLSIFPTIGVLFLLAFYFVIYSVLASAKSITASAPILEALSYITKKFFGITNPTSGSFFVGTSSLKLPFFGDTADDVGLIFMGVSVALVMMIPKTADMIKSFIEKRPFDYGSAIGEAVGPIKSGGRGIVNWGSSREQEEYQAEQRKKQMLAQKGEEYEIPHKAEVRHKIGNFVRGFMSSK